MIQIKFKNLEPSAIAREAVTIRLQSLIEKFPDLIGTKIQVTLEMENSPLQAGPDLFQVKVYIASGRYKDVLIEKENANMYIALAEVSDHLLEKLNRYGDKVRVKERKHARQLVRDSRQA